jgi:hypothetical protein
MVERIFTVPHTIGNSARGPTNPHPARIQKKIPWWTAIGVTILDYVVWRLVKDVIVCYRCQAVHRGYPRNPALKPFDLVTQDRHVYGAAPPGTEEGHG